jgi:hypothetical protein
MEKHEQINIALGVALLYIIITTIISLPNDFVLFNILPNRIHSSTVNLIIRNNILYIITAPTIIISLIIYLKKSNQRGLLEVLRNENVRLITGILLALHGLVDLSKILLTCINIVKVFLNVVTPTGDNAEVFIKQNVVPYAVSLVIILLQIFIGIYLAKCYKRK